jgi:hypothetical protein
VPSQPLRPKARTPKAPNTQSDQIKSPQKAGRFLSPTQRMNKQFKQQLPPLPQSPKPRGHETKENDLSPCLTFPAAELFPAALAVASPVGERGAALPGGTLGPRRVVPGDDLDPQHPVGEVDRVEGELEARSAAHPREIRVHVRTRPSCRSNQPRASPHRTSPLTHRCRGHRLARRSLAKP